MQMNAKQSSTRGGKTQRASSTKRRHKPVPKMKRFRWSAETMNDAVQAVANGSISQRQASRQYGVPRATLQKMLNGKTHIGVRPGKKPLFGAELETKLVDYAGNRATLGIGFGKRQFLDYAGQLAKKHKIKLKHSKPSDKWWRLMKKRNAQLRLRRPEGTAAVRHMCMDRDKVSKYFFALHELLKKRELLDKPSSIWNMDETGLQLQHASRSVVARKGTRYLQSRTSGNKETITVIACVSASGDKIPPHIIAKGKTERALHGFDLKSAPYGAKWSVSSKGWTKQGIARLWFESTFLPNIGPARPQVLILDGHDSHNFVELIELAIVNQIEIVELPAHTSNWLQPCDRTIFKPLKDAYGDVCQQLMNDYAGVVVSKANFCGLLSKAWNKAVTGNNIRSGFKACGIYPFNPDQIPAEAYIPNMLYSLEKGDSQRPATAGSCERSTTMAGDEVSEVVVGDESSAGNEESSTGLAGSNWPSVSNTTEIQAEIHAAQDGEQQDDVTDVERPCGIHMALLAVESSFSISQLNEYKTAYVSGNDLELMRDRLYLTWKGLKDANREEPVQQMNTSTNSIDTIVLESAMVLQGEQDFQTTITVDEIEKLLAVTSSDQQGPSLDLAVQSEPSQSCITPSRPVLGEIFPFQNASTPVDTDADVLAYPKPQIRKRNARKAVNKFFVLTSEEAYRSKLGEEAAKITRENEKAERKKKLEARKEAMSKKKESQEANKKKKRKSVEVEVTQVKRRKSTMPGTLHQKQKKKEENWQCDGCRGFYFDSDNPKYQDDWVTCVECHTVRFHNSCAVGRGNFDNGDLQGDFTCSACFA